MSEDVASSSAPGGLVPGPAGDPSSPDVAAASAVPERDRGEGASLMLAAPLWVVVVAFLVVALVRSAAIDIPLRDPSGKFFAMRILTTFVVGLVLVLLDALVRTARWGRPHWNLAGLGAMVRARWPWRRAALVAGAVVGYYAIYATYRNLKSWDVLNPPRDSGMRSFDKALGFGHAPGALLHDLLGTDHAAVVLAHVYNSFSNMVVIAIIGSLFLLNRVRDTYVFIAAASWAWIIGTATYYLIPTLGPFADLPATSSLGINPEFAGLRHTAINHAWAVDLQGRQNVLNDPHDPHSFAGISAFASLHTGMTCLVLLTLLYLGWKRVAAVFAVYFVLIIVSTIYFGWHYVVDDVAGVALAFASIGLARLMVYPRTRGRREAA